MWNTVFLCATNSIAIEAANSVFVIGRMCVESAITEQVYF